jgi:NitT/TauT family transport system permease protein
MSLASDASVSAPEAIVRVRRVVLPTVFILALAGALELFLRLSPASAITLAPPSEIIATLIQSFPILMDNAGHTAREVVVGFALGALLGTLVGVAMSSWPPIHRAIYPNLVAFQLIPKIALAPLFTLWLGVGAPSRIVFTIFLCFFPMTIGAVEGFGATPAYAIKLARSLQTSKWQTFALVRLPFAIPFLMTSLKVSATLAMVGIVVGEFVTAQAGLGYIILFASSAGDARLIFAAFILLSIEGLALYGVVLLLCWLIERWYGAPFGAVENA